MSHAPARRRLLAATFQSRHDAGGNSYLYR